MGINKNNQKSNDTNRTTIAEQNRADVHTLYNFLSSVRLSNSSKVMQVKSQLDKRNLYEALSTS